MKYALDTNLYVRAIREQAFNAELADFFARHAPRTLLSSVTDNLRDFARIGAVLRSEHTAPWPESA